MAGIAALALGIALLAALLLTPTGDDARGQLASTSTGPGGARLLHDLQERMGWEVERRQLPFGDSLASDAVYAVLDPPLLVTSREVHALLQAVRGGAGLLVVVPPGGGGPLADSLGISRSAEGGAMDRRDEAQPGSCPGSLDSPGLISWPGGRVMSYWLQTEREPAVVFTRVTTDSGLSAAARRAARLPDAPPDSARTRLAMAGYTLGRGRVVAVADPDLLRNDVLRVCRWNAAVAATRALDWLAATGGRRLVFDEYHQDPAMEAEPMAAVSRALVRRPWGRMLSVAGVAGLVLIAAAGARPLAPLPAGRVRRRSPLEHVQALARAYEQAGATRITARRLVRGLRRRHPTRGRTGADDVAFLHSLATRHPEIASDVAALEHAMAEPVPADQLTRLGDSIARLDSLLDPTATRARPNR